MSDGQETVLEKIYAAFGQNEYPGDAFLQGSFEGCEPYDEVGPFQGKNDWKNLEASFLDAHYAALSFFSQAGLRFFLPAYLVADLHDELNTADPSGYLALGFSELSAEVPTQNGVLRIQSGKSALMNPRRYGATTFHDYARFRLSVFTREEAEAIIAYLQYRGERASTAFEKEQIEAALDSYWLDRARTAPTAEDLRRHLAEQEEFLAAMRDNRKF